MPTVLHLKFQNQKSRQCLHLTDKETEAQTVYYTSSDVPERTTIILPTALQQKIRCYDLHLLSLTQ